MVGLTKLVKCSPHEIGYLDTGSHGITGLFTQSVNAPLQTAQAVLVGRGSTGDMGIKQPIAQFLEGVRILLSKPGPGFEINTLDGRSLVHILTPWQNAQGAFRNSFASILIIGASGRLVKGRWREEPHDTVENLLTF